MNPSIYLKTAIQSHKKASFIIDMAQTKAKDVNLIISASELLYKSIDNAILALLTMERNRNKIPHIPHMQQYRIDVFRDLFVKERVFEPQYLDIYSNLKRIAVDVPNSDFKVEKDHTNLEINHDLLNTPISPETLKSYRKSIYDLIKQIEDMI